MTEAPTVSVVLPTYNSAQTVHRALSSVLAQTLQPFEIIVVDDGSTDDTVSIVEDLSRGLPPGLLKLLKLESNQGCYYARNAGWDMAQGQFIALLDSDDSWHPRKLEIQADYMIGHDEVALTAHRCTCLTDSCHSHAPIGQDYSATRIARWHLAVAFRDVWTTSIMMKRDLPFRFDPVKRYSGDRLLLLQVALSGFQIRRLDVSLGYNYKIAYGQAGLSRDLWETERSELDNFRQLRQMRLLNRGQEMLFKAWSLLKYVRRVCLCWMRRYAA